jgi:hypothetical protein
MDHGQREVAGQVAQRAKTAHVEAGFLCCNKLFQDKYMVNTF